MYNTNQFVTNLLKHQYQTKHEFSYNYKTVRHKLTPFPRTPLTLAHREHSPWDCVCVCVWRGYTALRLACKHCLYYVVYCIVDNFRWCKLNTLYFYSSA